MNDTSMCYGIHIQFGGVQGSIGSTSYAKFGSAFGARYISPRSRKSWFDVHRSGIYIRLPKFLQTHLTGGIVANLRDKGGTTTQARNCTRNISRRATEVLFEVDDMRKWNTFFLRDTVNKRFTN